LLGAGANSLQQNKWVYIEFKVTVSPTAGAVELRVNKTVQFSGSGLVTQVTGNSTINTVGLYNDGGGLSSPPTWDFDNIVAIETTGGRYTDFIGPADIGLLRVNGDGFTVQSTPTAATNWQSVNGKYPNVDSSYSSFPSSGELSLFQFEDLVRSNGAIFAAALRADVRKLKGGVRQMQLVTRPGTSDGIVGNTNFTNTEIFYITESPLYHSALYESNPGYGGTWTVEGINYLQGGKVRIS
jgi:hypothetical protein